MATKDVNDELADIFQEKLSVDEKSHTGSVVKQGSVVPPSLAGLECPFTWRYNFTCDVIDCISRVEGKLSEEQEDDELIAWKNFVLNTILCYEYAKQGDTFEAVDKQTLCESILNSQENSRSGPVMGAGLLHICLACKCFLKYECHFLDDVKNILDVIVPYEDLNDGDKASVLSIRGAFCSEYGYSGIKESLKLYEEAISIDKGCGEWYFLLGRSLGRLRRMEDRSAIPDRRELRALEQAMELSKNAAFMVSLAQSYRETARTVFIQKKRDLNSFKPFCDALNEKAVKLYRETLLKSGNNVHILVRCALGLMKLPYPWKDLDQGKSCILKALELAPKNPMANHVAGTYYSTIKDYKQSLQYHSKAAAFGVFGAEIDIITIKRRQNEKYVPVADLERLLGVYTERSRRISVLCLLGYYCYDVKHNFKEALEYWWQVIKMDINSPSLKVHYDALKTQHSININKIIITEVLKLLDKEDITEKEREFYENIIQEYIKHHPGLVVKLSEIDVAKYRCDGNKWKSKPNECSILLRCGPYLRKPGNTDKTINRSDTSCDTRASGNDSNENLHCGPQVPYEMSSSIRDQRDHIPARRGSHRNTQTNSRESPGKGYPKKTPNDMPATRRGKTGMPHSNRGVSSNMTPSRRGANASIQSSRSEKCPFPDKNDKFSNVECAGPDVCSYPVARGGGGQLIGLEEERRVGNTGAIRKNKSRMSYKPGVNSFNTRKNINR